MCEHDSAQRGRGPCAAWWRGRDKVPASAVCPLSRLRRQHPCKRGEGERARRAPRSAPRLVQCRRYQTSAADAQLFDGILLQMAILGDQLMGLAADRALQPDRNLLNARETLQVSVNAAAELTPGRGAREHEGSH